MQEGIEDPANAGSWFRMNRSLHSGNGEAGAGLYEPGRKRRRRSGRLGTPGRAIRRGMKSLGGRFRTRPVMQRASLPYAGPLATSHLALRLVDLRQQRHHWRWSEQQDQCERDDVPGAVHLSAVYLPCSRFTTIGTNGTR
jgi:hypothetical protein